ncbi:MAG TPA: thioredoxin family protein [Phycisphaerales bacterium]|nr:thioredoxin family protein [Phycisphaerales bacterium]
MKPAHPALHPRALRFLLAFAAALAAFALPAHALEAVEVTATPQHTQVAPGGTLVVAITLDHGDELHSWPARITELPKAIDEFAIRTSIDPAKDMPAGVHLTGVQWPTSKPYKAPNPDGNGTIEAPVYSGKATAYAVLKLDASINPGDLTIPLKVRSQSCNDDVCFPPKTFTLPVNITVAAQPSAAASDPTLFAGFDQGKVTPTTTAPPAPLGNPTQPAAAPSANPAPAPAPPPELTQRKFLGMNVGSSLLILFLLSVLGGAVLNLTPCVLPIIPIKIMTLVEHSGGSNRRVVLGLWMAVGVVAFWTAVGLPVVIARMASNAALDPTRFIFGTWWVTLGLGVLIALMGLGIMGLFSLNLPQSVYLINPKADTARGSFFFGVMTGVLGLPCFGFVAGGLLAGSAALPASTIFAIFVGLGIGMAVPYLVLSINPALVKHLPRTGPASDLVKQVMGFLLLAAAAYFIAVGIKTFLAVKPWYHGSMPFWSAGLFVAIAALWLLLRTWQITKGPFRRVTLSVLAIAAGWGAIAFAYTYAQSDRRDYDARMAALKNAAPGQLIPGAWSPFDRSLLEKARTEGHTVMVDFTADWCLTCKSLKRGILDQDPVRTRLRDVVLLEADVTADEAPAWDFHKELGQTGVPTLAIYGPGLTQPVILNAYTPETVIDALNRAATKPLTQR